jgi:prepilin-type N-terminal cleavage/methylation domain-containing protein
MKADRSTRGFTLIEVIVVIAVVSILASMAVPYAVRFIDQGRVEGTRRQLEEIHRAIVGDPRASSAGFVGDMGRLPASLPQLITRGTQPSASYGLLGVKHGWDGPYVRIGYSQDAYLYDGWGRALVYSAATGRIQSRGPNPLAAATADDIWYPPANVAPAGSILVNLHVWRTDNTSSQYILNPQPVGPFSGMRMDVRMYYSVNGVEQYKSYAGTPPATGPPYVFSGIAPSPATPLAVHAGFHAVTATCTLPPDPPVSGQAVVYVPGDNRQTQVNLFLR